MGLDICIYTCRCLLFNIPRTPPFQEDRKAIYRLEHNIISCCYTDIRILNILNKPLKIVELFF